MRKLLIFFIFLNFLLIAQPPSKFVTSFGSDGIDIGYSLKELKNRRYLIVGSTSSHGAAASDVIMMVIDSAGNPLWQKLIGGPGVDVGRAVTINPVDSSFILAGYTSSFGGYDAYCIRTDKFGAIMWEKHFGGPDWDFAYDIKISADGNILVAGTTYNATNGMADGLLAKLKMTDGDILWSKNYGGDKDDSFCSLVQGSNGNIYIAGNNCSRPDGKSKFWCVAADINGDTIFSKVYGHTGKTDVCYDIMEDKLQKLVLCGSYDQSANQNGSTITYVEKIDLLGNSLIQFTLTGAGPDDRMLSVTNRKTTNDYFFSRSVLYGTQLTNVQPIMYIDDFTFLQSTTYGGFGWDEAYDVISTSDGGFAMIGYTKSYSVANDENIYFVKLDSTFLNAQVIAGLNEGVTPPEALKISIFARRESLYVQGISSDQEIFSIFDVNGRLCYRGILEDSKINFTKVLDPGIYILELESEKKRFKFLVSN